MSDYWHRAGEAAGSFGVQLVAAVVVVLLAIVLLADAIARSRSHREPHRHVWIRGRYAGAGWTLYHCADPDCPALELDA